MLGIRNMVIMIIVFVGIVLFVGVGGLGVVIYRGIIINNLVMIFLGSLFIVILVLVFDFILGFIEKRLINYKRVKYKINLKVIILGFFIVIFGVYFFLNLKKDKIINIVIKFMIEGYILG